MPYVVKELTELYDEDTTGKSSSDLIGQFLSRAESKGFRLLGILPDHQHWDDDGMPAGKTGTMLILHREESV